jgi:hypothetical protein
MARVLAVPIRLDALHLSTPLTIVEAKADFTRLPYWDALRQCEINPDIANISEELVSYPFQDRALVLPRGVHLHWALPDALARGRSETRDREHRMSFPAVPNRWLVTRTVNGKADLQWIVESDYLHPNGQDLPPGNEKSLRSIAIPFPCDREKGERPFRYLGRKLLLSDAPGSGEYLSTKGYRLTVLGYEVDTTKSPAPTPAGLGEPTFAAFYPNCVGVFGLHDPDAPANGTGLKYDVVGWFTELNHDCLPLFSPLLPAGRTKATAAHDFTLAMKESYGWEIEEPFAELPNRTLFHASIDMAARLTSPKKTCTVTAAIGNTVTEALSAYLGKGNVRALKKRQADCPPCLERQLEALHLADRIDHLTIDVGSKFQHARHERGFSAVGGGTVWTVRVPNKTGESTNPVEPLADDIADLLNKLNLAQRDYDQALDRLDSMQKQLFADWYKYMLCAYPPPDSPDDYPDIDEVRYFIAKNDLQPIAEQKTSCEKLKAALDRAKVTLERKLKTPYVLQSQPLTRYYRPHEPVVLIAGADDGLQQTQRHAASQPPVCKVLDQQIDLTSIAAIDSIRSQLTGGANPDPPNTWHPFALDWRVEMQSLKNGNNLKSTTRSYSPRFIQDNFKLLDDNVDLTLSGAGDVEQAASIYSGSSLMTSHARLQLKDRINTFLENRLLRKYYEAHQIPDSQKTDDYFEDHIADISRWYDTNKSNQDIGDPVVDTMIEVAEVIDALDFHVLAQSLNGFNEALLMHKQTLQLPLAEPLGFDDARDFTASVARAVGKNTYVAPQPLDDFQPLRAGGFKVLDLRLVDTFGRVKDIVVNEWLAAETMPQSKEKGFFSLAPRLVQPARLSFQWLSGSSTDDQVEMNSHPATSPICGWLLPNHLDNSLMVYDNAGTPQGSIANDCSWLPAPGYVAIAKSQLPAALQELVIHLTGLKAEGLESFFTRIENALENINPASAPQHDALALLVGRPIAVVRAQLQLELRGEAAINQSWDSFRSDLARCFQDEDAEITTRLMRKSDGVTAIRFPIRLGDTRQLNDGLLGYWIETPANGMRVITEDALFHCGNNSLINLTIDDPYLTLTMLVDPRGVVHLTSGILPAEVLEIPQDQYQKAMNSLEVTFLTEPVLSAANNISLPVPLEPGRAWSWITKRKNEKGGIEWIQPAKVGPVSTQASWGEALEIHEGWLRLGNADKP